LGAVASGRQRAVADRRGRELEGSQPPPARVTAQRTSLANEQNNLAPPPQTHVRKKLASWHSPGNDPTAACNLNG